jgi:hypothetical protein
MYFVILSLFGKEELDNILLGLKIILASKFGRNFLIFIERNLINFFDLLGACSTALEPAPEPRRPCEPAQGSRAPAQGGRKRPRLGRPARASGGCPAAAAAVLLP